MSLPLCSIIIPTYNCRAYLPIALHSIAIQDAGPVEILVLDDGSTDGSWDYLQKAKKQFPELVIVKGGKFGPSKARNTLISMAKANLIAFLDADDLWWPNKLKQQLAFHQSNPDIALSFSDYIHVDMRGRTHGTAYDYWKPPFSSSESGEYQRIEQPLAALLGCNVIGTSTVMARKDALQNANGFAIDIPSAEDWDLWLRMAENGNVASSSAVTMSYLQRPGSLTANREARLAAMSSIMQRYEHYEDVGMRRALRLAWSRYFVAEAEHFGANGDHLAAAKAHFSALLKSPSKREAKAMLRNIEGACREALSGPGDRQRLS